ncbi:hypothetical protein O53_4783 [Microcystis aeruginosa TAIHU98]|uniref:Uncharacterized protein n=1 Tax=Microcystis aeruginosa TAIHU98 TaxID=1134457 RepID=L7E204_MICAE|nr:hypothetical protein O53_4783 [Microcystis aeruginosa TAIHU98]
MLFYYSSQNRVSIQESVFRRQEIGDRRQEIGGSFILPTPHFPTPHTPHPTPPHPTSPSP